MAQVFLSYARGDAARARPIAAAIEKAGHKVWWDRQIEGGTQYAKAIEEALAAAEVVVVLWSAEAVDSHWVRDEAAAGRDSGRLVPISLDGTEPPLGFRQYQTMGISGGSARWKAAQLKAIVDTIASVARGKRQSPAPPKPRPPAADGFFAALLARPWRLIALVIGLAVFSLGLLISRPWERGRSTLPSVEVAAADPSSRSTAAANDLFVKLGSLSRIGDGKWQLLDSGSATGKPDLLFRTSDNRSSANLVLLDGKRDSLLWSREFTVPTGGDADLRQQVSLTAGRVLGCALDSRQQHQLSADILKTFLDACASLADISGEDYGPVADQLRKIVERVPQFEPAWSRLIMAESTAMEYARFTPDFADLKRQLTSDAGHARAVFPNLPELAAAELRLRDKADYGNTIAVLSAAIERAPDNVFLISELSNAYLNVGRMADAASSARRAAELDPLSPGGTTTYIMTLAHAGEIAAARAELAKAESLWAGTGSLRDAQLAFHVRYGDPAMAMKLDPVGYNTVAYYKARADPSPGNIARLKAGIDEFRPKSVTPAQVGWAIQSLAEFGLVDDVFYWLARLPDDQAAGISYLLFRPALAPVRRDPRFMPLAKRVGLVDYWRKSGKWPDYCSRPGISYDCKAEAAKLG